jgi:ABC-type multidrug transport system fused ATPase/permease subunit
VAESTDVQIVISAITEAAQQAIDEVGDELTGIADDAGIGQTALDQLSDELGETAGAAEVTQAALDELQDEERDATIATALLTNAQENLGDELEQNTAKATAASGAMGALTASAGGASFGFRGLSLATTLALIPALLALSTVLAPLVVTLGALAAGAAALAGAFGLIIGSGILAFGEQKAKQNRERLQQVNQQVAALERLKNSEAGLTSVQQARLDRLKKEQNELKDATTATGALGQVVSDLKEELKPLIVDFGEEFVPLIKDAINAIPTLVREMLDAVGGTDSFKEALRDFGAILMDVLPALVGLMFDLARTALPVLRELIDFLQGNGDAALQAMADSVSDLEPELRGLLDALIDAAPVVLEFGTNMAEDVVPVLEDAVRLVTAFMEAVNGLPEPMQGAANGMLLALPLFVKFSGVLGALIPSASTLGAIFAYLTNPVATLSLVMGKLTAAGAAVSSALGTVASAASTVASIIAGSTAALVAIGAALGAVGVKLLDMVGFFDVVGDAGEAFGEMMGQDVTDAVLAVVGVLSFGLIPLLGAVGAAILQLVRGDLSGAVDAFMRVFEIFGGAIMRTLNGVIDFLTRWGGRFFRAGKREFNKLVRGATQWGSNLISSFANAVFGFDWVDWGQELLNDIGAEIQRIIDEAPQWGREIAAGIADGIRNAPDGAGKAVAEQAGVANEGQEGLLDVQGSPVDVPVLQSGGFIEETGLAYLHAGEQVIPPDGQTDSAAQADSGAAPSQGQTGGQPRTMQEAVQTIVQGGLNVNVDTGEFGRNPRQDSRTLADQLRRELRNQNGSTS